MHAEESNLLEFLKKSTQFTIPIFQRTYSWGDEEVKQLWDDIIRTGKNEKVKSHFIGSIVYILHEKADIVFQSAMVIDGQQRLTTLSLLLEALARHVGDEEPYDGFSAEKIRAYYLVNHLEKEERKYKLLLTQTDKDTLTNLVTQKKPPVDHSIRIKSAFDFFKNKIAGLNSDLRYLCNGLAKLMIVSISLSKEDNPQLIFESMNSTGKELSQADLIRNYVLMDQKPDIQTRLYQEYWRPMELGFGQEAYELDFDAFMRHYLTLRTGRIPRIRDVYKSFKEFSTGPENPFSDIEEVLDDLCQFSEYYGAMALGKESDPDLSLAFHDLRELTVDTAYPLMLELYADYRKGTLSKDNFLKILRLTESYVFRRAVCGIPPNSLNKTFANFTKNIDKREYLESVAASYQLMPSYRRYPTDEEFQREIKHRDLYNFRGRSYWLRRLENHGKKELINVGNYTIEHIMPQNENLSEEWQRELGPEWKEIHESMLHTLGNLTLTGYNSEYSDKPFREKQIKPGEGFLFSPLKLNQGLGQVSKWNKDAIIERADRLANQAVDVWTYPNAPAEVLQKYKEKPKPVITYSLDNFGYLAVGGYTRGLFESLRKEILALDPVIYEEILKVYIAYKAETNFVDVTPLSKSLYMTLNMPFAKIYDPEGICRNVSKIGRWGNGEIEVRVKDYGDIPYVMSLIRQSFEHQMGNGQV